jgi:hypothetical protein
VVGGISGLTHVVAVDLSTLRQSQSQHDRHPWVKGASHTLWLGSYINKHDQIEVFFLVIPSLRSVT